MAIQNKKSAPTPTIPKGASKDSVCEALCELLEVCLTSPTISLGSKDREKLKNALKKIQK